MALLLPWSPRHITSLLAWWLCMQRNSSKTSGIHLRQPRLYRPLSIRNFCGVPSPLASSTTRVRAHSAPSLPALFWTTCICASYNTGRIWQVVLLEKKYKCIGGEKIHSLVDQQHQLAEDVSSVMGVIKAMKETGEATVSSTLLGSPACGADVVKTV